MKKSNWLSLMLAAALLAGPAYAEDEDEGSADVGDEDTIVLIDDETTVEDIVSQIRLPESASETAREKAAKGLETANAARDGGRAFGQSMAEGRGEAGRAIGEAARDARGSAADVAAEARQNASDVANDARNNANNNPGRR
jgi:hypothetical protein